MSALSYELIFANTPFINDNARTYQYSRESSDEREGRSVVRKQQSEGWLWDDVQRVIPTEYLQDFGYAQLYPGRNTGSLARQLRGNPEPGPRVSLGDFYYPVGATRWSYFRGLATSTQVKSMLAATQGNKPATFTISSEPISQGIQGKTYTVSTQMYMLPPRPLGETAGTFDGLYLVTLVDERYFWQFSPQTTHVNFSTTWAALISQIASSLKIQLSYSTIPAAYLTPEPDSHLWTNQEDIALLLDCVAFNIGRVLVRGFNGVYTLMTPEESLTQARTNRADSTGAVIREAGGDCFASGTALPVGTLQKARNISPTAVRVTFPKYVTELPVPHFAEFRGDWTRWYMDSYNGIYPIDTPISSGGALFSGMSGGPYLSGVGGGAVSGNGIHTIFNTAKALYSTDSNANSGAPVNVSGLTALANQITRDYYAQNCVDGLDEVYLGILNWTPEGLHDLLFTWSARKRLGSTRVMRSEFNMMIRDMQHCTPAVGGGTGYAWVPGMAIMSGYTISDQGTGGALNLDITNININGGLSGTTNLSIPENSSLNIVFEDFETSLLNIVGPNNTPGTYLISTFIVQEGSESNLFISLNPGSPVTITTQENPDQELIAFFVTQGNPTELHMQFPSENTSLSITGPTGVDISTLFVINNNNIVNTFQPNTQQSIGGPDPDNYLISFLVVDNENRLVTTFEQNAILSIASGDDPDNYIVSFLVVDITTLQTTILNGSIWSITGGELNITSLLVIDGRLEGGYVTQDPVEEVEQVAFFVVEDKPINRIPINVDANIRGISRPTDGRALLHTIFNVGSGTATIYNNDSAAIGSEKILTPGGTDITLPPNGAVQLWYDPVSNMNRVYFAGGSTGIVPLSLGGTGSALADPNADRILFWDDSAGQVTWLSVGTGLEISDTTLQTVGGSTGVTPRSEGTLVATGSTQSDAAPIVTNAVVVTGADNTKGVILPNVEGAIIAIYNNDVLNLKVYPTTGAQINALGTNNAYTLSTASATAVFRVSSTQWVAITVL